MFNVKCLNIIDLGNIIFIRGLNGSNRSMCSNFVVVEILTDHLNKVWLIKLDGVALLVADPSDATPPLH